MNLLLKLAVEGFTAFGNWLWAMWAPGAVLNRLTFKRVLYLALLIFVVVALVRIGFSEGAFIWAGDAALYFEVASTVIFFAVKGPALQALQIVGRQIRATAQGLASVIRRYGTAMRQRRNANALRRKRGADGSKRSDDEPAAWIDGPYASAAN